MCFSSKAIVLPAVPDLTLRDYSSFCLGERAADAKEHDNMRKQRYADWMDDARKAAYENLVITVRLVIIAITVQFLEGLVITVNTPVNAPS